MIQQYYFRFQYKFYLVQNQSQLMNKSSDKRSNPENTSVDRTKVKSIGKEIQSLTFVREIVIKTQEPDIPQITIIKVQKELQNRITGGLNKLESVFQRIKLKRLFQGLGQISTRIHSSKMHTIHANRLMNILKNRQKRYINLSWNKLRNLKLQQKTKLNTSILISKLSSLLLYKVKASAFDKIKGFVFSRIRRSITQSSQSNLKKTEQGYEKKLSKIKSQQFSQKFLTLCKKFLKINQKNFIVSVQNQIEPNVIKQIERLEQLRTGQPSPLNNQIVLIVLNNHIITIKGLKKQLEQNNSQLKDAQSKDLLNKLNLYEQIEKQFEQADNQIRDSFERHKKIQQAQLAKIVEAQLKLWNKSKDITLYNSRLFLSAIVVKLIKDGVTPYQQFLEILEDFITILGDPKKLEEFKKKLNKNQRGSQIIVEVVNKIIQLSPSMPSILQRGFSENQQAIMTEIKYIKQEIKDFITKFNNPNERTKLRKVFSSKKPKAPQQVRQLYTNINQLISMIQNSSKKQQPENSKKSQVIIKILTAFKDCLKQGNYKKWENFLNTQIKKGQHQPLLELLDGINDILNDKIKEEVEATQKQLQKIKNSQAKLRQQNEGLKAKNSQLQKKLKALNNDRSKSSEAAKQSQQTKQKDKKLSQIQKKYNQLNEKYLKLQKQAVQKKPINESNKDKQIQKLKKQLEQKTAQINKLQQIQKSMRQKSQQKLNSDQQAEKKLKQFEKIAQKFKQQLQAKNKQIAENEAKIKKYEQQMKNYQVELSQGKNNPSQTTNIHMDQTQFTDLVQQNQSLNKKLTDALRRLQQKQAQMQKIRKMVLKQQGHQVNLQKAKSQKQALLRRINILDNTIQNLKHDLEQKNHQLEQAQLKSGTSGKKGNKSPFSKTERSVQQSLQLIKQLNKQLQKLKRSEITLQQINKQLENVQISGQDVQTMLLAIELENREFKKTIMDKDKTILDLADQVAKYINQITMFKVKISKTEADCDDKQQTIKRLQASLRDREQLMNRNQQTKNSYISKLQKLISQNEQTITELNLQVSRLRTKQPEIPTYFKIHTQQLENALREVKISNEIIRTMEREINDAKMGKDQLQAEIIRLNNELTKKNTTPGTSLNIQQQKQRWIIQANINFDIERRKWQQQTVKWDLESQKYISQIKNLQNQIAILQNQKQILSGQNQNLNRQNQKILSQAKINFENERQKWEAQAQNAQNWNIQKQNLDRTINSLKMQIQQLQNDARLWQLQRQKLSSQNIRIEKQKIVFELNKNFELQRQKWALDLNNWNGQRQNLIANINSLKGQIEILNRNSRSIQGQRLRLQNLQQQVDKYRNDEKLLKSRIQFLQSELLSIQQQLNIANQASKSAQARVEQLLSEQALLHQKIETLRTEITTITSSKSSIINIDNIVLLLTNIAINFIRIHPRPDTTENERIAQKIYKDLFQIKDKLKDQEGELFISLEEYVVQFIESDIGKYRQQLISRIQQLNQLRDRLVEFLNGQIEISKDHLKNKYQYETKQRRQRSTAAKSLYETPIKSQANTTVIIKEIKQKTTRAQKLFESGHNKNY